ncbi:MAG: hypothetical protein JKX76_02190 [Colwellia sp.]|nr:hypothetical protein [Colwellia sp.]
MLTTIIKTSYFVTQILVSPLEFIWKGLFGYQFNSYFSHNEKITIISICAGAGKTTLANNIVQRARDPSGPIVVSLDECTFHSGWTRNTPEKFKEILETKIDASHGNYVIEGNYSNYKMEGKTAILDEIFKDCDKIIWIHIPWYVSFWRTIFRSFKRWFDLVDYFSWAHSSKSNNGVSTESWKNVKAMASKTGDTQKFAKHLKVIEESWDYSNKKYVKVSWPKFYY